ncbi:alkaline shock response membrane anchor protein AmaP [Brassicibacter mesophilus]|uniref:alkaline shock response membrane anchor protein AmaP n=1 Tax=Brassicibacter mesophilus TaxID=745119 RepID=UPI003D1B5F73
MKILDRIVLTIYTFCLAIVSIVFILIPFDLISALSINNVEMYFNSVKGNYLYSIIGLAFLLVSIRFLLSGLSSKKKEKYIVRHTNLGELKISTQTVEGLAQSITSNFTGIKDIKTNVIVEEEGLIISIKGLVNPDVIIPETTVSIQNKVKEHIEKCTGVEVQEIKVEIINITTPTKVVK